MIAALALLAAASATDAPAGRIESPEQVPQEVRAFVEAGTHAIWVSAADLDRDGDSDYLIVLDRDGGRSLLIVVREADGLLRVAKRNDRIVMCADCGGLVGDPFVEISSGPGTFAVEHFGGGRERWGSSSRFNYSRRDHSWQLVEVSTEEFDSFDYENPKSRHEGKFVPPKDFGKIDIADFDPDDFKGRGER